MRKHLALAFSLFSFSKNKKADNDYNTTGDCALFCMTTKVINEFIIKIGKKKNIWPHLKFFSPPPPPAVLGWLRFWSRKLVLSNIN